MTNQPNPNWGAHGNGGYPVNGYAPSVPFVHTANAMSMAAPSVIDCILPPGAYAPSDGSFILKAVVHRGDDVGRAFGKIFELVEKYVVSHMATAPSGQSTRQSQYPTFDQIGHRSNPLMHYRQDSPLVRQEISGAAPSPAAAIAMVEDYQGRIFLMARVLTAWLCNRVFTARCFEPLNDEPWNCPLTVTISRLAWLVPDEWRTQIRYDLVDEISQHMQLLRTITAPNGAKRPGSLDDLKRQNWFTQRSNPQQGIAPGICNLRGDQFWPIAAAVFPSKIPNDWIDLLDLMQQAHMLAFKMFGKPCEYEMCWFEPGVAFDPEKMVARGNKGDRYGNYQGMDGASLKGKRVAFVMTPMVMQWKWRAHLGGATSSVMMLMKAQVLVRR